MSHVSQYKPGLHLFVCDVCGTVHHSDKKRIMWDGTVTCGRRGCFDMRHPQEGIRGKVDKQSVDNPRPEATDVFLAVGDVTVDDI